MQGVSLLPRWTIGDVVRKLRTDRGWTQREFAKLAGMAMTAANRLEQTSDLSDQRTIRRAAQALGVPVSLLYRYAEFTTMFAELTEAQQNRVMELMREYMILSAQNPRSASLEIPDLTATVSESEAPTKARRAR